MVLAASAGAWSQQINPDRRIPGLPPLGKEQPPDPSDPADQPDDQDKDKQPDAAPAPDGKQGRQTGRPTPRAPETDDQLLARLAKAPDQRAAPARSSASCAHGGPIRRARAPTCLLKRIDQAIEAHDEETARTIAEKLTEIAPDFAEGWHRRATLAAEKDDFQDAIDSLRRVLALQPKHFIAMAELGQILEEFDDKSARSKPIARPKSSIRSSTDLTTASVS